MKELPSRDQRKVTSSTRAQSEGRRWNTAKGSQGNLEHDRSVTLNRYQRQGMPLECLRGCNDAHVINVLFRMHECARQLPPLREHAFWVVLHHRTQVHRCRCNNHGVREQDIHAVVICHLQGVRREEEIHWKGQGRRNLHSGRTFLVRDSAAEVDALPLMAWSSRLTALRACAK